jgi:mRNA interferase YafQ
MLKPSYTKQFLKDLKLMIKRGKNEKKIKNVMKLLIEEMSLEPKHRDHKLLGNFAGSRDCHIEPDWILIYTLIPHEKAVRFERTGTHSDLFR